MIKTIFSHVMSNVNLYHKIELIVTFAIQHTLLQVKVLVRCIPQVLMFISFVEITGGALMIQC